MASRGVHFAITTEQADDLLGAEDDDELLELVEAIEEAWRCAFETDKAWDALHRCLSDGTLDVAAGEPPLNRVFLGGRVLNEEDDFFVVLVTPAEVKAAAEALAAITEDWLRERYGEVPFPGYEGEKSDEDRAYMIESFRGLPAFFARAASEGAHVIFTVDA